MRALLLAALVALPAALPSAGATIPVCAPQQYCRLCVLGETLCYDRYFEEDAACGFQDYEQRGVNAAVGGVSADAGYASGCLASPNASGNGTRYSALLLAPGTLLVVTWEQWQFGSHQTDLTIWTSRSPAGAFIVSWSDTPSDPCSVTVQRSTLQETLPCAAPPPPPPAPPRLPMPLLG
jgi:hypothetical protein